MVGYYNQFDFAARVVLRHLRQLEWIRVADPEAGAADDFQFCANGRRVALQVKWADVDPVVNWGDFTHSTTAGVSVIAKLASAWSRMTASESSELTIYLVASGRPSANAVRKEALLAATTSETKSFAKFYETAFEPLSQILQSLPDLTWSDVQGRGEVDDWKPFWERLEAEADVPDFASFLRGLRFEFGAQRMNVADALLEDDRRDERKLANLFAELVVSPDHVVQLTRAELLARLGWVSRADLRRQHEFPLPIAYSRNQHAEALLTEILKRSAGGYLAVVGAAGTGKSTLLSEYTLDDTYIVRYFAFVPNDPDFRSARGEAESFLHDLTVALDAYFPIGSLAPTDRRGLQERILQQLQAAREKYRQNSTRTVIIIDGLDHIPREQDPERSLLQDLPTPSALGPGVFVVLGSQSLAVIPDLEITNSITSDRLVEIPPLTEDQIAAIVSTTGLDGWLLPRQMRQLVDSCEGHPLALQYLVAELRESESLQSGRESAADRILEHSQLVGGDVSMRYQGYLQSLPPDDEELERVLALISRLRVPVNMDWVRSWAGVETTRRFESAAGLFFRIEGRVWRFVHNSFRRFLAEQTSIVGESTSSDRDRRWHLELAELCAIADKALWRHYSDEEIPHRFLGGDVTAVLERCNPERLRSMLFELRPFSVVGEHLQLTLESAAEAKDGDRLAALLLFRSELSLRGMSFERDDQLATAAVNIDPEGLGIDHVLRGSELRSSPSVAALLASHLSKRGHVEAAGIVLDSLGGLSGMRSFVESSSRDWAKPVTRWAESFVAVHGTAATLTTLDAINPIDLSVPDEAIIAELEAQASAMPPDDWRPKRELENRRDELVNRANAFGYVRDFIHLAALRHHIADRNDEGARDVISMIDGEAGYDFRVLARIQWAEQFVQDSAPDQAEPLLREIAELVDEARLDPTEDEVATTLRLRAALVALNHAAPATDTVAILVPEDTEVRWPETFDYQDELDEFEAVIRAFTIEELLPEPVRRSLVVGRPQVPAERRISDALERLCRLEVACRAGHEFSRVDLLPIVRMLSHIPESTPGESVRWTSVRRLGPQMLARLTRTAMQVGSTANLATIRSLVQETWADPSLGSDWSLTSRITIIRSFAPDVDWATNELEALEASVLEDAFDPFGQVELWLSIAEVWNIVGNQARSFVAMRNAVSGGLGVGIHESDDQLEAWPTWIPDAVASGADATAEVESFASRLRGAASVDADIASRASAQLVKVSWALGLHGTAQLADSLAWAGTLQDADHLEQLTAAVLADPQVEDDVALLVTECLLLPTRRGSSSDVVGALSRFCDSPVAQVRVRDAINVCLVESDRERWSMDLAEAWAEHTTSGESTSSLAAGPLSRWILTAAAAGPIDWASCPSLDVTAQPVPTDLKALFGLMRRHGAPPVDIAAVGAQLALRGEVALAAEGLTEAAGRTDKNGWNRQWDGGSRRAFWDAAVETNVPEIRQLAARDLARSLRGGRHYDVTRPSDLASLLTVVAFTDPRGRTWESVTEFLDHYAPVGEPVRLAVDSQQLSRSAEALLWVMNFLDHPIRQLDVGARRVITGAICAKADGVQQAVARGMNEADAGALESILHALLAVDRSVALEDELVAAVSTIGTSNDAIVRFLAAELAIQRDIHLKVPLEREFNIPNISMPAHVGDRLPPLGEDGVPLLDPTQPRQHLVPFDRLVSRIAKTLDIDESYLLHRTSEVARHLPDRWVAGGTDRHAANLKVRGLALMFRPWHYMAGRRAVGRLIAELVDGGLAPLRLVDHLDLVCIGLDKLPAQALPPSVRLPLLRDDGGTSGTSDWEAGVDASADAVLETVRTCDTFVLAEISEFQSLAWETPAEHRQILTAVVQSQVLWTPPPAKPRAVRFRADQYFLQGEGPGRVQDESLIIQGCEELADAALVVGEWIAINPRVARALGWVPIVDDPFGFGWAGHDGAWRARSQFFKLSQLSHRPPSFSDFAAQVWQVQLSDTGRSDLSALGHLSRTLVVRRRKPGRSRHEAGVEETRRIP